MNNQQQLANDVNDLIRRIDLITKDFDGDARRKVMKKAAAPMVMAAKINAPESGRNRHTMGKAVFSSGNLANSIEVLAHGPFKNAANVYIGPRYPFGLKTNVAPYAHMVEFGTAKQRPQPFLQPAFERNVEVVFGRAKRGFTEILDNRLVKLGMK